MNSLTPAVQVDGSVLCRWTCSRLDSKIAFLVASSPPLMSASDAAHTAIQNRAANRVRTPPMMQSGGAVRARGARRAHRSKRALTVPVELDLEVLKGVRRLRAESGAW